MGAGILPVALHHGKLFFLFGKENKYADTPGFSDFGGGTEKGETFMDTAIREGGEEMTGFLGSDADLKAKLKQHGTYNIDLQNGRYRMHLFQMPFDESLPHYYNNNQRFLQLKLDPKVIQETKIFEKAEIRWFSIDEMRKRRGEFRSYFQPAVDTIIGHQDKILDFFRRTTKQKSTSLRSTSLRSTSLRRRRHRRNKQKSARKSRHRK
jgi:hypothetical protein